MSDHLISMVVNIPMAVNFLFKINEAKSFKTLIEMHHRHTFVDGQVDLHFSRNTFNVCKQDDISVYMLKGVIIFTVCAVWAVRAATENFLNFAKLTCFFHIFKLKFLYFVGFAL